MSGAALLAEAARLLLTYRLSLRPGAAAVRRELLPETGAAKAGNADAIAIFAGLAPPERRAPALRAMIAFQLLVDLLDEETEGGSSLREDLDAHAALAAAVGDGAELAAGPRAAQLVAACRGALEELPARAATEGALLAAAIRCGEAQSRTHAAAGGGPEPLEEWARRQPVPGDYRWWEVAAGASSSVAVHALIAAAADPGTSAEDAARLDAAYHPSVGALTVVLDDLVDREEDLRAGEHNYLSYYEGPEVAADRLAWIAHRADAALAGLPQARRHRAILAGVAGYYLARVDPADSFAGPVRARLLEALGAPARFAAATVRWSGRG
jgi:tetraprenyl-beta-curcumene synthase